MPWRAGTLRCAGYAKDAAGGRMDELAVDPACIVGGEEGDDVADVAGIGYSSERALGRRPGLCRPISEPIGHVGIGETWRVRVHGDLAIAKIPCDGAGQGADRPFGRRVHGRHRAGDGLLCGLFAFSIVHAHARAVPSQPLDLNPALPLLGFTAQSWNCFHMTMEVDGPAVDREGAISVVWIVPRSKLSPRRASKVEAQDR